MPKAKQRLPALQSLAGKKKNAIVVLENLYCMKSLTKKKNQVKTNKVAQCCAKNSKIVAGCHD